MFPHHKTHQPSPGDPSASMAVISDGQSFSVSGITAVANLKTGSTYSLKMGAPARIERFELHDGDSPPVGGERSEMIGIGFGQWANGIQYWISDAFYIDAAISGLAPGGPSVAFNVFGQVHHKPAPGDAVAGPPFWWDLRTDMTIHVVRRTTTENPITVDPAKHDDCSVPITFRSWIQRVQTFLMDPTGGGFHRAWINGAQVLNFSGATGFATDTGPHWQWGVYRQDGLGLTPVIVWYANIEAGTNDLTARITTPLPTPFIG